MSVRRLIPALVALAGLAAAPAASAHSVKISRSEGDVNTLFVFAGSGWGPGQRVTAEFFFSDRSKKPLNTFKLRAANDGRFRFKFRSNLSPGDYGVTQSLCFKQFDTRVGRTYRKCKSWFLRPPSARFESSTGKPGDLFVLVVEHFFPGHTLNVELTRPDGTTETSTLTTLTKPGTFAGPNGSVYVPKGGSARTFQSSSADLPGRYTVLVSDGKMRARAVVVLEAPTA